MIRQSAREVALASVGAVRDDPDGRLALMRSQYHVPPDVDRGYLPYRQAASAFIGWQLRRGLLNPIDSPMPGSPWWRAVNERLLHAGRLLGDPRLGMTSIFLSLLRVLPDRYPLGDDIAPYARAEHGLGHLLDIGVITPRAEHLYAWSASELDAPGLRQLVSGETPCYAWPANDRQPWNPAPSRLARLARRILPVTPMPR